MTTTSAPAHDYRLFGWRLRSTRPLPFLYPAPADAEARCDVEVCFGPVHRPDESTPTAMPFTVVQGPRLMVLARPEGVRVRIEDGRRMTVDVDPGVGDAELHTWLFGPAVMMLCHQRGQPPLHASVLDVGGRGVAIAGDSGAGKSTTARALMERGHRLMTDDKAVIDPESRLVYPGYPSMKLWDRSAAAFGDTMNPTLRVRKDAAKFHMPQVHAFQPEPVPLALVVVLDVAPEVSAPTVVTPTWSEAASLLHRHLSGRRIAKALDGGRAAFHWTTTLARRVAVHVLRRPDDLARLDELCDTVERLTRRTSTGEEGGA